MGVDLKKELLAARKLESEAAVLAAVEAIFAEQELQRTSILEALQGVKVEDSNQFDFDLLQAERIFTLESIKKVCIDYRLRFLESARFRNHFPEEALIEIRRLEKEHQTKLGDFQLMAPTNAFRLDNYDDPLLFVPLGNGYFYLIHQWGDEINAWRKWMVLPLRNLGWFTFFCLILSLVLTWMIPINRLGKNVSMASLIIFLFLFKSVFAVAMYGFFMRGRTFSATMWNSRFYNQ